MPIGFEEVTSQYDPYKNFKFRVLMDQKPVLGVSKVSALKRTPEVVKRRNSRKNSANHQSPDRSTYATITLEQGITHDREFERWANLGHADSGDTEMDFVNCKKDLTLEVLNEEGHVALRYFLYGCWVSDYKAIPDPDPNSNAVATETIKIEIEGWDATWSLRN